MSVALALLATALFGCGNGASSDGNVKAGVAPREAKNEGSAISGASASPLASTPIWRTTRRNYQSGELLAEDSEVLLDGEWTLHGRSRLYSLDGSVEAQFWYELGALEGVSESWFPNGVTKSLAQMKNGARHGAYVVWNESGTLALTGFYSNDTMQGTWTMFHSSGMPHTVSQYKGDERNGSFQRFSEAGILEESGQFREGEKDGTWQERLADGQLVTRQYAMGKLIAE